MKKTGFMLYLVLITFLFVTSCSPTIRFDVDGPSKKEKRVYLQEVSDKRPVNERVGYKIFYVDSISDEDYPEGFAAEFRMGIRDALEDYFIIVKDKSSADVVLHVDVHHFYGEYSQTVKTVFWEYGSALLLFIPRLLTDAIPYNEFAGRVAFDMSFDFQRGNHIQKSIDVKVTDSVTTYMRGSADTASRLSNAASPKLDSVMKEIMHQL
ncbi:MAG: hypothetical protein MJE63_19110 [Proteobacteria bacterium]|nr:hypothetical protein [Pseudomonadota bacterium]